MRPLSELQTAIDGEIRAHPHLHAIRGYNRAMMGELARLVSLQNAALLDLGASIHGYALEAAMEFGVASYEGIDLDIGRHWGVPIVEFAAPDNRTGRLQQIDAEHLAFRDGQFDVLFSISTFEHFLRPDVVLGEMHRVLRRGGSALLSFEPIWTASYGHHLHHFGAISDLVPPWSHLFLDEARMREVLQRQTWPDAAPIDLDAALRWIYHGSDLNRFSVRELHRFFADSPFETLWIHPLTDSEDNGRATVAEYVSRIVPYERDELLTRGLSVMLRKP